MEHNAGLNNPVAFLRREFMKAACSKRKNDEYFKLKHNILHLKNIAMKVNNSTINLLVFENYNERNYVKIPVFHCKKENV